MYVEAGTEAGTEQQVQSSRFRAAGTEKQVQSSRYASRYGRYGSKYREAVTEQVRKQVHRSRYGSRNGGRYRVAGTEAGTEADTEQQVRIRYKCSKYGNRRRITGTVKTRRNRYDSKYRVATTVAEYQLDTYCYSIRQNTSGYRSKGCPSGKYYDEETNGKRKCRKCVICPKGYTEHLPCSKTTNRSCKPCEIGTTFTDKREGICRNCTECQRGQFVSRQCLPFKDTRCKICPNGTYSLDRKGFGCKYCSVCKEHEEEVSPCTPLQNRECSLKEDYTFGTTNPWNTGPEYNKDFNFSTRLVLLSLLMVPYLIKLLILPSMCGQEKYFNNYINVWGQCKKCRPCA
ncbi:uncharacterized protein LOC128208608 [Mya arenaria]|uniref:uncharacterized protein LOC128208608 n=1 Tax=Mya arenaria TaxID=6604 RepID=UPI0022DEA0C2|nr:uncharacterized protein LOC128208608 [Mya arenaria]